MVDSRFTPNREPVAPYHLLDQDGTLHGTSPLTDGEALEALRWMVLTRTFDDKATAMQRQGRFGTFSAVRGQEAAVVGASMALDPARDWIAPQYRELPALLRHGYPMEHFAMYFMGNPRGGGIPTGVNMLPLQISLAAQIPQAVGIAWGLRLQGSDGVVVAFFGDGASSEGDFHESLNLAGLVKAPVIFFLQNNGWAISTPRDQQTAARTFAERAPGYGIEGVYVDGNDLLAVSDVMRTAVAKARRGEGPTLVEAVTHRTGPHNTADDPTRYVDEAQLAQWQSQDPIERVQNYLTARGKWGAAQFESMRADCAAHVDEAMSRARAAAVDGSDAIFDHVYANPVPRVVAQRAAWAARNGGGA